MTDFLGNEMRIGDDIIVLLYKRTSASFKSAKVVGFTPTMIQYKSNEDASSSGHSVITPIKVVDITAIGRNTHIDDSIEVTCPTCGTSLTALVLGS